MKPLDSLSDDEFAQALRRAVALPDAPAALVHQAIGLWPERAAAAASPLPAAARSLLRQVVALLSFDSWAAAPMALGMRSSSSAVRQLLFSAEDRDIDLRVTPQAELFMLAGQVLGPDGEGRVELVAEGEPGAAFAAAGPPAADAAPPLFEATLDALGEFRLPAVPQGRYRLRLQLGSDEIVLPPIDVGP